MSFLPNCDLQPVPFDKPLNGFYPPQRIRIVGIANPDATRFEVDLMANSEYHFHFNPRFNENVVVRNSTRGGNWQNEERSESSFPFAVGRIFTIDLIAAPQQILVNVDGQQFLSFNCRDDPSYINHLAISGDVNIHSVHIGN
uniref:Galectin n=1 Tax=Syphacia muris TaxID=451379 RepID=A0A0N5B188_9BILA